MATAALLALAMLLASCYEPSPLYGTWADNSGNSITFIADGTFVAKVANSTGTTVNYEGNFSVIDNVLIFSYKQVATDGNGTSSTFTMNTEWDIRGSMLYLSWTAGGETTKLSLYHTAR